MAPPENSSLSGMNRRFFRMPWIILSGILVFVLLAGVNVLLDIWHEAELLRQDLEAAETTQTLSILQMISVPARTGDWVAIQDQFSRLETVLINNHLRLTAPNGTMLANSQAAAVRGPVTEDERIPARSLDLRIEWVNPWSCLVSSLNCVLQVSAAVTDSHGQIIAILENEVEQQAKFAQLYQDNFEAAIKFFLWILLILALILMINWKLFIQPLNRIYSISNAIKSGKNRAHLPGSPVLEVDRINTAFNEMIDYMTEQHKSLEQLNHQLEVTVADRTAELEASFEAEYAQRKLAEALRDVTATLASTLDQDEVLDGILSNLGRVVPHHTAMIMLIEGDLLYPARWQGIPDVHTEAVKSWVYPVSELHNRQRMIQTLQTLVIPDTELEPFWVKGAGLEWIRAYAGAPICQRGEVTGFIDVMSEQPGFFPAGTGDILQAFANQAAISLENARLYTNAQTQMAETSALYRAIQPLFSPVEDIEALSRRITESVTKEFSSAHCSILLLNEKRTHLNLIAQSGSLHLIAPELPLDGRGLTVTAIRTGRPIYSPNVHLEPNYIPGSDISRSELAIPLYAGGQVIGVLNLESTEANAFDQRGQRLLASFAEQAALGLENARLFATIRDNAEQMTRLTQIAQRRAQEAETMRLATSTISSTLDLQTVLGHILDNLEQVVPHDSASMFLVEDEQHMRVWAARHLENLDNVHYYPRDNSLFQEIEKRMQPVALEDAMADPRFCAWSGTTTIRSWMGVPLTKGNELVGILTLDRIEYKPFKQEETELAQAFANQAAIAVQNARLYESAQRRARELEALHTATTSLVSTLEIEKLLDRILVSAISAIPTTRAAAVHLLDETGQMHLRVQHGMDEKEAQSPEWNANNSLWAWVLRECQPSLVSNSHRIPPQAGGNELPGHWDGDSLLIAPLIQDNQTLGLITLISAETYAFDEHDLHLLVSFASTATAAIHNAQLHSEVQNLAITDPLTGVYNRRGFFNLARHILEHGQRYKHSISVIMIDIDFFKNVNDQFGHDAGDIVLQTVTQRCRKVLRETDLICRYGGEEFTILLSEGDLASAYTVASRLYSTITETPFETEAGPVRVTVSMGMATSNEECDSLEKLLKCADQALYLAKDYGRNQVQVWDLKTSA
jgi:diguanylate cyclase (GGDEF)-like protein